MIAIYPQAVPDTTADCRCFELNVTCACNTNTVPTTTPARIYVHIPARSHDSTPYVPRTPSDWQTPKYRSSWNLYTAPERFESQPLPLGADLRVWLHRKPTRRSTAKAVRNWRQQ